MLLAGFTNPINSYSIRKDEVQPILNNVEKQINEQKTSKLGIRITQKVFEETVWNNEDIRNYAIRKDFDDVFIVSMTLHVENAKGNAFFKTSYLNIETGVSEIVNEEQRNESSMFFGDMGNNRTRDPLVKFLLSSSKEGDFPELDEQPKLAKAQVVEKAKVAKMALAEPILKNVPEETSAIIPGLLLDVISESRKFQVVARSAELDAILKEQSGTLSAAFNPETAVSIGKISGASLLLGSEFNCLNNQCQISLRLFDLTTGSLIKASSRDSEPQHTAMKNVISQLITQIDDSNLANSETSEK